VDQTELKILENQLTHLNGTERLPGTRKADQLKQGGENKPKSLFVVVVENYGDFLNAQNDFVIVNFHVLKN